MVEEPPLTDAELDAALTEAFAVDPSPDFVARVRGRIADQKRPVACVACLVAAAALGAAALIVTLTIERRPFGESRSPASAMSSRGPGAPAATPAIRQAPQSSHSAARPARPNQPNRSRDKFQNPPSTDVLIPVAEQQALQRLLERPPTSVLRFAPSVEPTPLAAIAIPPLTIDPLLPEVDEGGHQ
jgi:hypothetical protein